MGAHAVNQFTDRVFLARYSDDAIQASLPGGILSWLFICLLVATASYSGTFVAQFHGAGSKRDAAAAYGQGLWLALAALPLILLSIPLGYALFNLAGHAPAILADEKAYYGILQLGGVLLSRSQVGLHLSQLIPQQLQLLPHGVPLLHELGEMLALALVLCVAEQNGLLPLD